jgi:hypothetical protein
LVNFQGSSPRTRISQTDKRETEFNLGLGRPALAGTPQLPIAVMDWRRLEI